MCVWCVQDFADELDVMPSITMENNVIHNNEGYGVILVKANSGEQQGVPADPSEGLWSSQSFTCSMFSKTGITTQTATPELFSLY